MHGEKCSMFVPICKVTISFSPYLQPDKIVNSDIPTSLMHLFHSCFSSGEKPNNVSPV